MPRFSLAALSGVVLALGALLTVFTAEAPAQTSKSPTALVPAVFNPRNDPQGVQWYMQQDGTVHVGNGAFSSGGRMVVANMSFSPQQYLMTPDGSEYHFTGQCNQVQVARRVKIDLATSTVRFIDTLTNTGPADLTNIEVVYNTSLRSSTNTIVTDLGESLSLTKNDKSSGVVAISSSSSSTPWVAFFTASPRAKLRPIRMNSPPRSVQPTYMVTIPRNGSITLVTGIRTHPRVAPNNANPFGSPTYSSSGLSGKPDPKDLAAAMAPFLAKDWLADLPRDVRKQIVNHTTSVADGAPSGLPLRPLHELLERYGVATGETDVLLLDDETTVKGRAAFERLSVTTVYGRAEPKLEEVAAVVGGNGQNRPMQVLLRNGEILVGQIEAEKFIVTTDAGLQVDLVPALMNVLVLRAVPTSSLAVAPAFLTTTTGDRFGVEIRATDKLTVATPWGVAQVPLEAVESFIYRTEPQPGTHLRLRDHSQLTVFLTGPALELESLRWGKVSLPGPVLRRWDRTVVRPVGSEEPAPAESDGLDRPHVRLGEEAAIVGSIDATELRLATPGGLKTVKTQLIMRLERLDDGEFECTLVDGSQLTGLVNEPAVTVAHPQLRFRIPIQQVASLRGALPGKSPATTTSSTPSPTPTRDIQFTPSQSSAVIAPRSKSTITSTITITPPTPPRPTTTPQPPAPPSTAPAANPFAPTPPQPSPKP